MTSVNQQMIRQMEVLPSYLECFEKQKVNLFYAKKPSLPSDSGENSENVSMRSELFDEGTTLQVDLKSDENLPSQDESFDKGDLTGDPLQVDLGGDETLQIVQLDEAGPKWSISESKHYSFTVKEGRKILNNILKRKTPEKSDTLSSYIICNGDDNKKTVFLGSNLADFMACSIHVLGTLSQTQVEDKIKDMVEDHRKNCFDKKAQIHYSVKLFYNLYGRSLKNIGTKNEKLRELSTHGNVSVDIVVPDKVFNVSKSHEGSMKMHLEVVAGHPLLSLNFLWHELAKLQELIDIISESELSSCEQTVICKEPLDQDIILQGIVALVSSKFLRREVEKDVFDLKNLRQEDLLDGLWNLLNRCENVADLRDCFTFLFEELADGNIKTLSIKDDCAKVSTIIKGILQGKIGLSTISLSESVEFLFELGAQKLKFDFQAILAKFTPYSSTIDTLWKAISQKDAQQQKKSRKTRVTRALSHIGTQTLPMKVNQLAYLSQLYIGSEFIYLLKDKVHLSNDGFQQFCKCIEKEYISDKNKIMDFNIIYQSPLNEISFGLDLRDVSIVESVLPSRWTMSMQTGRVTTIYDLSDSPIFPPVIHDYDVPVTDNNTENLVYFVSKMNRSTEVFE